MKIGILLPASTTHPMIGYDFLTGVQLSLQRHATDDCRYVTANIGFGTDKQLVLEKAEHLCLNEGVDVLVAFIDGPHVPAVSQVAKALNKLLLIVHPGAKYPASDEPEGHVICLTHHEWLCSALTGEAAAENGHRDAVLATNFYDSGYALAHAMTNGFTRTGGEMRHNFIGKHLEATFDAAPLLDFMDTYGKPLALLSIFSGPLTLPFLGALQSRLANHAPQLYGSSTLLAECAAMPPEAGRPMAKGYCAWISRLDLPENREYCAAFSEAVDRQASAVGALGWDVGVVLAQLVALENLHRWRGTDIPALLLEQPLTGTRGTMLLDEATQHYLAPVYWMDGSGEGYANVRTAETLQPVWKQQMNQSVALPKSGWFNTYLCS